GRAGAFCCERSAAVDVCGAWPRCLRLPRLESRLGLVGRGVRHLVAGRDRGAIEDEELRHEASFRDSWLTVLRLRRRIWFGCCRGAGFASRPGAECGP